MRYIVLLSCESFQLCASKTWLCPQTTVEVFGWSRLSFKTDWTAKSFRLIDVTAGAEWRHLVLFCGCLCPFCTCPLWASLVLAVGGMFICVTRASTRIVKNIKLVLNSSFFSWQLSESSHMLTIEKKNVFDCFYCHEVMECQLLLWCTCRVCVCVNFHWMPLQLKSTGRSQRWKIHMVHVPACMYTVPASASTDDMWY